jgi:hypothetical protein
VCHWLSHCRCLRAHVLGCDLVLTAKLQKPALVHLNASLHLQHSSNAVVVLPVQQEALTYFTVAAAQVTEEAELEEIHGSRRSLGSRHSLDSPKHRGVSEKALQLEAVAEAAPAARTWRQRLPWGKPKLAKADKPAKKVGVLMRLPLPLATIACQCCTHGNSAVHLHMYRFHTSLAALQLLLHEAID